MTTAEVSLKTADEIDYLLWHILEHASLPTLGEAQLVSISEFRDAVAALLNDTDAITIKDTNHGS